MIVSHQAPRANAHHSTGGMRSRLHDACGMALASTHYPGVQHLRNQRRKIICPHTRYLFDDPLPCLLWYYGFIGYLLRGRTERGR